MKMERIARRNGPFAATSYFAPSEKQFMQNFRVNDLENC
jgi:hypothetical protein